MTNAKEFLCDEYVEVRVVGCPHGHRYRVKSSQAECFSENPKNCTERVTVRMPMCGHEIRVPCHQEPTVLDNPSRCAERCRRLIEGCGHKCKRKCGECLGRTLEKNPDFVLSASNAQLIDHGECKSRCGKTLLCGHKCEAKCHPGEMSDL